MLGLQKFVFYSFILHLTFFGSLAAQYLFKEKPKIYYAVDFYGGSAPSPKGNSTLEIAPVKKTPVTTKAAPKKIEKAKVNPKENILIKSKKKNAKKTKVSSIPAIPRPKKSKEDDGDTDSETPSVIPGTAQGTGTGVEMNFGPDGWGGGGSAAGNFPHKWYTQAVKKKVGKNWDIRGGFGRNIKCTVAYTIEREGTLQKIEVEKSSGHDVFDYQAKRAIEASTPFPPLPRDYKEPTLTFHTTFTVKK